MRWFRKWRLRFRSLFDRSRVENDLEDELRDYIDRETEREVAAGATPEEAKRRALSSLGCTERLKEECRDARGIRWLEDTFSDVRFAVRTLRKAPVFTLSVTSSSRSASAVLGPVGALACPCEGTCPRCAGRVE